MRKKKLFSCVKRFHHIFYFLILKETCLFLFSVYERFFVLMFGDCVGATPTGAGEVGSDKHRRFKNDMTERKSVLQPLRIPEGANS